MTDRDRLAELRQLAHDVRNALNGATVNLEVARSRARRGIEVDQVTPFLETAAQQLEAAALLHKRYTDVVTETVVNAGARDAVRDAAPANPTSDSTHSRP